jgi:hypothetical protein
VGLKTLPCKKKIFEKPPRNSAGFVEEAWPKLACGAKERRKKKKKKILLKSVVKM